MHDTERRTCETDCENPATHRLENPGGEHLYTCESCADVFGGDGTEVTELPEGRRYVYTDTEQNGGIENAEIVDHNAEGFDD